eukprot:743168_1
MSTYDSAQDLSNQLRLLSSIESRGTRLISLYIPTTQTQIQQCKANIQKEMNDADNIKDSSTKKSVKRTLLQLRKKLNQPNLHIIYPNGIAIFCGDNNKLECIHLLQPIHNFHYKCSKKYNLNIIYNQINSLNEDNKYMIILVNGNGLCIGETMVIKIIIIQKY